METCSLYNNLIEKIVKDQRWGARNSTQDFPAEGSKVCKTSPSAKRTILCQDFEQCCNESKSSVIYICIRVETLPLISALPLLKGLALWQQREWGWSSCSETFLSSTTFSSCCFVFSPWADMKGLIWKCSPNISISIDRAWGHEGSLGAGLFRRFVRAWTHLPLCKRALTCERWGLAVLTVNKSWSEMGR